MGPMYQSPLGWPTAAVRRSWVMIEHRMNHWSSPRANARTILTPMNKQPHARACARFNGK